MTEEVNSHIGDVLDDTSPPENDAEAGSSAAVAEGSNNKKGGKDNKKGNTNNNKKHEQKEQVPIEELYDLSQPIKRVSWYIIISWILQFYPYDVHKIFSFTVHSYMCTHHYIII